MPLKEKYDKIVESVKAIKQIDGLIIPVLFINNIDDTKIIMLRVENRTELKEAILEILQKYRPVNELIFATEGTGKKLDYETGKTNEIQVIMITYISHKEQFGTVITYTEKDGKIVFTEEARTDEIDSWIIDAFRGRLAEERTLH